MEKSSLYLCGTKFCKWSIHLFSIFPNVFRLVVCTLMFWLPFFELDEVNFTVSFSVSYSVTQYLIFLFICLPVCLKTLCLQYVTRTWFQKPVCLILYIKMNVCLFVCLFVCLYGTYTNPHFWTDLNQTLHMSPPWSGGGHRVCMDPQYFNFPTFSTYFVGSECLFVCRRWLPAPESPATVLYPVLVWRHRRDVHCA
jgi:hypothetical protein